MRVVPNRRLEAELRKSREVEPLLKDGAETIAEEARNIAQREAYQTGAYRNSIEAVAGEDAGEVKGRVVAKDFKAGWIEFGYTQRNGVHIPGKNILSRAADAAGFNLERRGR